MTVDVEALLAELTVGEKIALVSGADVWRTRAVPHLGIGSVKVTDGPNGARGDSTTGAKAVCVPASIALGATFDVTLVTEVGRLLGRETVRKGAHVLLAPTINLARHPLGGRNFESFGEDPRLTSVLGVAYVTGVQDEGVGACAKHFVANDVEHARLTVSSEVDQRTLREVYLAPFEAVVDADVWSVMAAYPKLNGVHCTENRWLLTELLREEWGFQGAVMSDWGATHHRSKPILAGLDLEMPGPPQAFGENLEAAIVAGEIGMFQVEAAARRVLDLARRSGRLGDTEDVAEQTIDRPEDRDLVRRAARESMVLLRNDGVLPLSTRHPARVAVVGPNAHPGVIQGGGSALVPAHRMVSPVDGLAHALPSWTIEHHPGCLAHRYLPPIERDVLVGVDPIELTIFQEPDFAGEPSIVRHPRSINAFMAGPLAGLADGMRFSQRWRSTMRVEQSGEHRFGVSAIGRSQVLVNGDVVTDNWTAPEPGDAFFQRGSKEVVGSVHLDAGTTAEIVVEWTRGDDPFLAGLRFGHLPPIDEDEMLDDAVRAAASADSAVVVVGLNADWETESQDRPLFGLPGRQDELVRRVATANDRTVVVINAGGPVDLPWLEEVPAILMAWYPGQEFGSALADVLTGHEPGGRLPVTFPMALSDAPTHGLVPGDGSQLHYREGVLVGHRWYDAEAIEPRRPFGFGLSYTGFDIGEPLVISGKQLAVRVPVTNTGDRPGKCVIQVYVEPPSGKSSDHVRPVRQLAGFAAAWLEHGASEQLTIDVPDRVFEIWDAESGWTTPTGSYRVWIGTSSRDLVSSVDVER